MLSARGQSRVYVVGRLATRIQITGRGGYGSIVTDGFRYCLNTIPSTYFPILVMLLSIMLFCGKAPAWAEETPQAVAESAGKDPDHSDLRG